MLGDNITVPPNAMDFEELVRRARANKLPQRSRSPYREMIGQRAYRVEAADEIIHRALAENRTLTQDERRSVDTYHDEAAALGPVITELWNKQRAELMER